MTKNYANAHPKYKENNQDKNIKVADLKVGGKKYTSKQFKALSPSEQQSAIELMVWEYEQKVYDKLGIK